VFPRPSTPALRPTQSLTQSVLGAFPGGKSGGYGVYDSPPSSKGKGKANPEHTWRGPEGSRRLRFPDFKATGTHMKVVRLSALRTG